jgi:perosamine synthetase
MKPAIRIPVYQPELTGKETQYVTECLTSTWISSKGAFLARFEGEFAAATGVRHATAVCNGTVAMHLALLALDLGPGDEVIVPTLTYIASVNAIRYVGATPVFVDSLPGDWQMDPAAVERRISPRTRAIVAVHLYGHPCDMPALLALADRHGLRVVEDCAEALGTRIGDRHVGTYGHISAYSFFGNKTITTGEGGMVVTNDPGLHQRAVHLKGQGLARDREYFHDIVGYNYRMTNVCAAIGCAQLERLDDLLRRKRALAEAYRTAFAGLPVTLHTESPGVTHSFWMCSLLVHDARHREPLRDHLRAQGIETRPVFYPAHTMPMYRERDGAYPVAEDLARRGLNLPSWPALPVAAVAEIAAAARAYFAGL